MMFADPTNSVKALKGGLERRWRTKLQTVRTGQRIRL